MGRTLRISGSVNGTDGTNRANGTKKRGLMSIAGRTVIARSGGSSLIGAMVAGGPLLNTNDAWPSGIAS